MRKIWVVISNDADHLLLGAYDNKRAATDCECYWNDCTRTFVAQIKPGEISSTFRGITPIYEQPS
jgi:hypothetical protein